MRKRHKKKLGRKIKEAMYNHWVKYGSDRPFRYQTAGSMPIEFTIVGYDCDLKEIAIRNVRPLGRGWRDF